MSKMKPKKYGESLDVTSDHKPIPSMLHVLNNDSDKKDQGTDEND